MKIITPALPRSCQVCSRDGDEGMLCMSQTSWSAHIRQRSAVWGRRKSVSYAPGWEGDRQTELTWAALLRSGPNAHCLWDPVPARPLQDPDQVRASLWGPLCWSASPPGPLSPSAFLRDTGLFHMPFRGSPFPFHFLWWFLYKLEKASGKKKKKEEIHQLTSSFPHF